jgi:thiaminase/transcriptional activator TenA
MAQSFWNAAAPLISTTEKHPFLVSMVKGTLPLPNFRYYVIQDALYLTDFAAALRIMGDKFKSIDEATSRRLHEFATGAEECEKSLHNSFFKQWDINDDNAEMMPNTLLYTSYMIRVCSTRCEAEGLAVLLPCFWVYMHVGKCMLALREELGETVERCPQFDAWIDMYGGEEFEKEVKDYIEIVDRVAREVDGETLKKMEEHFIMSCKLEHMFWDQAQELMVWPEIVENGKK